MQNIDICIQVILVEQCKPVAFEQRPRLEKVTCPKFFNGCVPRNEFTILGKFYNCSSLSDLFIIMRSTLKKKEVFF